MSDNKLKLKKYIVVDTHPPKVKKHGISKEITEIAEDYKKSQKDSESDSNDDINKILDDLLIIEQKVIEIINTTNNFDCNCFTSLKSCFNKNKLKN